MFPGKAIRVPLLIGALIIGTAPAFSQGTGQIRGTVYTVDGAIIPGTEFYFHQPGSDTLVRVQAGFDAEYSVELPAGEYLVGLDDPVFRDAFCPIRRSPFFVRPDTGKMINITLWTCHAFVIREFGFQGAAVSVEDPLKTDLISTRTARTSYRGGDAMIRYGASIRIDDSTIEYVGTDVNKSDRGETIDYYSPAVLTYDEFSVFARTIRILEDDLTIIATGDVIVEDGVTRRSGATARMTLRAPDVLSTIVIE